VVYNTPMSQGLTYSPEQREQILESLRPFLEAGMSRMKACESIGFVKQTLSKWSVNDPALEMRLKSWENAVNMVALRNIADAIQKEGETEDTKKETSKWWLERRMKQEFSTRTENTGADGAALTVTFDTALRGD
jgi:hypothetical protein